MNNLLFGVSLLVLLNACEPLPENDRQTKISHELSQEFKDYWYSGYAELNHYSLEQARYGEIHKGDAVLIFVTEDFLTDKQVKYELGERENVQSVLKLNFTRKFNTGIYPYSLMSSIFTPVNLNQPTLKVTTSSQEWCGHTFSQLNFTENSYQGHLFSYFQKEGDTQVSVKSTILEDAVWNIIRISPDKLPTGEITMIPGTQFLRFRHRETQSEKALTTLEQAGDSTTLMKYKIEYQDFVRVLEITFEKKFPHTIIKWEETTESGFGTPETLTTRAFRTHSINSPYWSQNSLADSVYRKELGF